MLLKLENALIHPKLYATHALLEEFLSHISIALGIVDTRPALPVDAVMAPRLSDYIHSVRLQVFPTGVERVKYAEIKCDVSPLSGPWWDGATGDVTLSFSSKVSWLFFPNVQDLVLKLLTVAPARPAF